MKKVFSFVILILSVSFLMTSCSRIVSVRSDKTPENMVDPNEDQLLSEVEEDDLKLDEEFAKLLEEETANDIEVINIPSSDEEDIILERPDKNDMLEPDSLVQAVDIAKRDTAGAAKLVKSGENFKGLQKIRVNIDEKISLLEEKMGKLENKSNDMRIDIDKISSDLEVITVQLAKKVEKDRVAENKRVLHVSAKDNYKKAVGLFFKGDYLSAVELFKSVPLSSYPEELQDNVVFWLGEYHYKIKEYKAALKEYERIVSEYPTGNKVYDAKYKMAFCYEKFGNTKKTLEILNNTLKLNPPSEIMEKIKRKIKSII